MSSRSGRWGGLARACAEQLESRLLLYAGAFDTNFGDGGLVNLGQPLRNPVATATLGDGRFLVAAMTDVLKGDYDVLYDRFVLRRYHGDGKIYEYLN